MSACPLKLKPYALRIFNSRSIYGLDPPSSDDVKHTILALEGREPVEVRAITGAETISVLAGMKRVRDAIRRGEPPTEIKQKYPELIKWQAESHPWKPPEIKRRDAKVKIKSNVMPLTSDESKALAIRATAAEVVSRAPSTLVTQEAIESIERGPYPPVNMEDPESLPTFLRHVKAKAATVSAPLAARRLLEDAIQGSEDAVKQLITWFWGKPSNGPTVAQQFNFGPSKVSRAGGLNFERIIQAAEEEDSSGFGMGGEDDTAEIDAEVEGDE